MATTYVVSDHEFASIIKARKFAIHIVEIGTAEPPMHIWAGRGAWQRYIGKCIRRKNGWVYRSDDSGIEYQLNKNGTLGRRL